MGPQFSFLPYEVLPWDLGFPSFQIKYIIVHAYYLLMLTKCTNTSAN
jgi:hypothetical protein